MYTYIKAFLLGYLQLRSLSDVMEIQNFYCARYSTFRDIWETLISYLNYFIKSLISSKNSYVHKRNWIVILGMTNQLIYTLQTLWFFTLIEMVELASVSDIHAFLWNPFFCIIMNLKKIFLTTDIGKKVLKMFLSYLK